MVLNEDKFYIKAEADAACSLVKKIKDLAYGVGIIAGLTQLKAQVWFW